MVYGFPSTNPLQIMISSGHQKPVPGSQATRFKHSELERLTIFHGKTHVISIAIFHSNFDITRGYIRQYPSILIIIIPIKPY